MRTIEALHRFPRHALRKSAGQATKTGRGDVAAFWGALRRAAQDAKGDTLALVKIGRPFFLRPFFKPERAWDGLLASAPVTLVVALRESNERAYNNHARLLARA